MESKLKFLSIKVKQFYFWKWAIPINLLFYLILFIIQIILLFCFHVEAIIPTRPGGNGYAWLILVQTFAGLVSITATVYTIKLERKFFYFNTMSMILFLFNNIMLGLYINGIKIFLLWFPLIVRYIRWNEKSGNGNNNKIPRRLKFHYFICLLLIYLCLSYGLSLIVQFDSFPLFDSIAFVFSLGGASLEMYGYIEGFVFALIASLMVVVMFFQSHAYTQVLTQIIWIISLVGTILAWLAIYYENYHTFKYIKTDKDLILINQIFAKYID